MDRRRGDNEDKTLTLSFHTGDFVLFNAKINSALALAIGHTDCSIHTFNRYSL
jgi:hypothetical protein